MFPTAPLPVSIATPTSLDPAAMLASTPQPQPGKIYYAKHYNIYTL